MVTGLQKVLVEKYRPQSIDEMILPKDIKSSLKQIIDDPAPPCLLFSGAPGIGKTTAALAIIRAKDSQHLMINGSLERNIEVVRNELSAFASGYAFNGKRKYVIIDEADNLNREYTQKALRTFTEEYSTNCGFILTANYPNKLIEPLRLRCKEVKFAIPKKEKADLAMDMIDRLKSILQTEKIEYEADDLPELVMRFFPNFRSLLIEVQYISGSGRLDMSKSSTNANFKTLVKALMSRNYNEVQKWYLSNSDVEFTSIVRLLYDNMKEYLDPTSVAEAIILFNKFLYEESFVRDIEIHTMALFCHIMSDLQFK